MHASHVINLFIFYYLSNKSNVNVSFVSTLETFEFILAQIIIKMLNVKCMYNVKKYSNCNKLNCM